MDGLDVLGGSGVASLALVAFYFVKLYVDSRGKRREVRDHTRSSLIDDTASANATLRDTLTSVQTENLRLVKRVTALEEELAGKDQRIDELEARIHALQEELQHVANDLGNLRHGN